jgi:hypothetical protein
MRNFIFGFLLGSVIFGAVAWAAVQKTQLVNGSEQGLGTTGAPLYITLQ